MRRLTAALTQRARFSFGVAGSGEPVVIRTSGAFKGSAPLDDSLEREKELFQIKRQMSQFYNKGDYREALAHAVTMQDKAEAFYGAKNPVFASCLNNTALMQKMIDNFDGASENYTKALHLYADLPTHGKRSGPYISTLSNLGLLYKEMAVRSKGMDKVELLHRAEEALAEALCIRKEIHGANHKDSITAQVALATVFRAQGLVPKCLEELERALLVAREFLGDMDLLTATIWNNKGLALKTQGALDQALDAYSRAQHIRSALLGDRHPESVVCMHNRAECLMAMGREDEAQQIQAAILAGLEADGHTLPSEAADGQPVVKPSPAPVPAPAVVPAAPAAKKVPPPHFAPATRRKK